MGLWNSFPPCILNPHGAPPFSSTSNSMLRRGVGVYYLIWNNHRITVRLLFISDLLQTPCYGEGEGFIFQYFVYSQISIMLKFQKIVSLRCFIAVSQGINLFQFRHFISNTLKFYFKFYFKFYSAIVIYSTQITKYAWQNQ